jgi:flagellar hook-associated protein 2
MGFGVDGLISGMNTGAMVDSMVAVYSLPQKSLERDISNTTKQKTAVGNLIGRIDAIDDAIAAIEDEADFKSYKADYADTDAFKVSTANGAIPGNYSIAVNQLATTELEVSDGFDDKSSTGVIAEGTLTLTYAGTDTEITVDSSNSSLSGIAAAIDEIDGLSAYVLNTGSASEPYKLVIQGEDTGKDNTIELDTSALTGSGSVPTFTEQRASTDAEVEINGIKVTDSDNSFGDAVPGLDIDIYQTNAAAENVTVGLDKDQIESNVQDVVDAYNSVISYVDAQTVYNTDLGIAGPLVGNTTVTRVIRKLASVVGAQYSSGSTLDSLSLMGITSNTDGTLSVDSSEFQDALDDNLDDVVGMFTESGGFGAAMREQIDVYTDTVDGTLESYKGSLEGQIRDLEDSVSDYDYRIKRYEERLRSQFATMESLLGGMQGTSSYMAQMMSNNSK